MIKVNNRKAIANLSRKSLKAGRLRNIVAVIAIALTATLFMSVFTIGGSIVSTMQDNTMRQVGTSSHAGFKFLTQEQYDILCKDPKIKDISYNIIIGFGENPELKKTYTEIRYTEPKAAEWGFSMPTTGRLPKSGMEVATSTAVLDALGVPHELGAAVPLTFTANGVTYSETFKLCGYYEMDPAMGASEAFVSREYCDKVAPVLEKPLYEDPPEDDSYIAGSINPSLWFATSWNIDKQVEALKERCGFDERVKDGVNWAYASSDIDAQSVLMLSAALLLILLSGYLIIYNVFYISVSQDIRFYGLLKTIGTTGRQLKKIVRKQAFLLCVFGIPLGLVLGWLGGRILIPSIMRITSFSEAYVISANPWIFGGAALFALLTVWISCIRPCRLAAKVSPIEAVRYTGVQQKSMKKKRKTQKVTFFSMAMAGLRRDKKKTAAVVLSLTLSMILLNATYTLVTGFDMNAFLKNKVITDFMVGDASVGSVYAQSQVFDGVTDSVLENIEQLDGLEGMGSVYMQEKTHIFSDAAYEKALKITEEQDAAGNIPHPYADEDLRVFHEQHKAASHFYGIDEYLWDKLELAEDTPFDAEKFKSGDYVIASALWFDEDGKYDSRYYDTGDKVTLDFGNGKTKEYTVLAIGEIPYAMGPQHGHYMDVNFTLPADEYLRQIGSTHPLTTGFDIEDDNVADTEKWIGEYCDNVESNLDYSSRNIYINEFKNMQIMFTLVGGALSFILGLIGVLNFVNAVITSIMSRRREFAMLQSVGMTGSQLKKMLSCEGMFYAVLTMFFAMTAGSVLTYLAVNTIASEMFFFIYHFTLTPLLLCIPALVLVAVGVPMLAYRVLAKHSVVERLREVD